MKLENWFEHTDGLGLLRICGNVYGNPNFNEGEPVTTSPVLTQTADYVKTLNSTYELGEPRKYTPG